jgi:spermidine synthase
MRGEMRKAGFTSFQTLHFPQPCYPTGWWSCTLARKSGGFAFREQAARDKRFETRYYSADIHASAQVLPPFVTAALDQ